MHAFLYTSLQFLPDYILSSTNTLKIIPENSIGIEEIRNAQIFLSRLPPQNQKNYLVVFEAEKMTVPAQNAFLKTLEEPPSQSEIYLITPNPDALLPTILSRVYIVNQSSLKSYTSDSLEDSRKLLEKLQKSGVGERLAVIDEISFTRDTFLHFLNDLEFLVYENITSAKPDSHLYSHLMTTKLYTQSNCNLRLVIDNFLAQIPTTTLLDY